MNKDAWELYKILYKDIKLTDSEVEKSWKILEKKLPVQDKKVIFFLSQQSYRFLIAALIVLLLSAVTVKMSEPGDVLYPVKVLSESIATKVTNVVDEYIEKREDTSIESTGKNEKEGIGEKENDPSKEAESDSDTDENTPTKKPTPIHTENVKQATDETTPQKKPDHEKPIKPTEKIKTEEDVKGESINNGDKKEKEKGNDKGPQNPQSTKP